MSNGYRIGIGLGIHGGMRQVQVLAPPIACDAADVVQNGKAMRDPVLDSRSLETIRQYIATENPRVPYSDGQILGHLLEQDVYSFDLRSVSQARKQLGIPAARKRR